MRVAVAYYKNSSEKVKSLAVSLAKGVEAQGHQVSLIDIETDTDARLTLYEYLLIGTTPLTLFSGKISEKISAFLKNSGRVSGTKSYAFIVKKGLFTGKALQNLMRIMEKEGMFLKISDIIASKEEAEYIGKKLHIN